MRCAGSPKWPGSFSLHEGAVGEWVVVRLVRSTYPGGWLLPTCSHAPHNGVHGYITCVTLMTTLNRKDGWQGNRRQPWRAGTPRGKRKGKRFLLSPHLKKTAKEQCNSTRARRSPREGGDTRAVKAAKQMLYQAGDILADTRLQPFKLCRIFSHSLVQIIFTIT